MSCGGDWNGRSLTRIIDAYPELEIVSTPATREDAILDIILTNYGESIVSAGVNHPLESESDTVSDHKIVFTEAKLPRQKKFVWETHYYMRTTDEGNIKFKELSLIHI